jgi:hypothetical protein
MLSAQIILRVWLEHTSNLAKFMKKRHGATLIRS